MSSPSEHPLEHPGEGLTGARPPSSAPAPDHTVVLDPMPDATRVMAPVEAPGDAPAVEPLAQPFAEPARRIRLAPAPPPPVSFAPREPAPAALAAPAPAPSPAPAPAPRRRPGLGVLAGAAAALVVVTGVAVAGLRSGALGGDRSAPAGTAAGAAAVAVPAGSIRAQASSTQRPDSGITYVAANTLDGRPETAWNSDGQADGAELTYTFAAPVDLASITVLNGYQKVRTAANGSTVDLFALNQRVKALRVVTDAGSADWTLRDDRAPQTLSRAFGRTRTVRLQVVSTYPSDKYEDLAVSEVRFTARG